MLIGKNKCLFNLKGSFQYSYLNCFGLEMGTRVNIDMNLLLSWKGKIVGRES